PNIDRLADRGTLFTNAHSAVPVCSGSRAANWSGLSPVHQGVYGNGQKIEKSKPDAVFLTKDLSAQGYRTFGTGKLYHGKNEKYFDEYGPDYNKWWPITDEETKIPQSELQAPGPFVKHHIPRLGITMPLNQMPRDRNADSDVIESFDWGVIDRPDEEFSDTLCAEYGISKLQEKHDKPFFIGVGIYRPHQPLWAPKRFHDLYPPETLQLPPVYQDDLDDVPEIARFFGRYPVTSGAHKTTVEWGQWRNAVSAYLACISYADYLLGRVLDALDASPYADNTMIVLWSDHGWQLGEKEHWGKFTAWERSTHVPLIIVPPKNSQPAGFRPGTRCANTVSLLDVYPTVVDLLGVNRRDDLDGRSLLPLIKNPNAPWPHPAVSAIGRGTWSVRDVKWRYTRYFDGTEELYNLGEDPDEWKNLIDNSEYSAIAQRLAKFIPDDPKFSHFVRFGEFKAVVPADGSPLMLFGPGPDIIYEEKDVSGSYPEVVQRIKTYLLDHPNAGKYLRIPGPI
ncbi:MAG: sulfatase, partial [Verrucomicrobiae bacterium]|nr:sulfatase [Verrucomicrobiae bacterium]